MTVDELRQILLAAGRHLNTDHLMKAGRECQCCQCLAVRIVAATEQHMLSHERGEEQK